jgi:hypothetical protein
VTAVPITEAEFDRLLATPARSAFRLETQPVYALGYERKDFDLFLAGTPRSPGEIDWWQPWLEQVTRLTSRGVTFSRVRILDEPPSDYQRWEMWGDPWHDAIGERIDYMLRSTAIPIGLPLDHDWWLLDDERLIDMRFDAEGEITGKTLSSDPDAIAQHREWRDLAIRHATPAGDITAA